LLARVFVGWALAQKLYHLDWWFLLLTIVGISPRPTLETLFKVFCQIAGGNQGAAAAGRPLEPRGAPSITLNPSMRNDVNVNGEDRPTYTSLYAPQFGHPWPLVQSYAFHPWPSFALSRIHARYYSSITYFQGVRRMLNMRWLFGL